MKTSTTHRNIESFLKQRQHLIVELMRASHALEHNDCEQSQVVIAAFCQCLTDYISTGYFGLSDALSPTSWATPREYALFDATTLAALTFGDRHATRLGCVRARVKQELADLALSLETRFEIEDDMLSRVLATPASTQAMQTNSLRRAQPQAIS